MSDQATGPGPATPPTAQARNVVSLAGQNHVIERVSGRKASRVFAALRALNTDVRAVIDAWGEFEREYAESHALELDRARAHMEYGARPAVTDGNLIVVENDDGDVVAHVEGGELVRYPDLLENGDPHPNAGEVVMVPGPVSSMSERDWEAAGNKLTLPRAPRWWETAAAVLADESLAEAEEEVYKLLALFTFPNDEVKRLRKAGTLDDALIERADELLDDADADELLELMVAVGEVLGDQFKSRLDELGERLGNALRPLGINPDKIRAQTAPERSQTGEDRTASTSTGSPATLSETPSEGRPGSSTDSGGSSDGDPTPPSTPATSSSPSSELEPSLNG